MPELIVSLRGRELQRVPIMLAETTIGRDEDCAVVLDNAGVSRKHAVISYRKGTFHVRDLGSQNGFTLNGKSTTEAELQYGDVLAFNKFEVHFSADGGVSPELLEPAVRAMGQGSRNVVATMSINTEAAKQLQEQWLAQQQRKQGRKDTERKAEPPATPLAQVRTHLWLAATVFLLAVLAASFLQL